MTQLLNQTLNRKRDLIRLRQRVRQLTRALGFVAADQGLIAAAVFHLGVVALEERGRIGVVLDLRDGQLRATPSRDVASLAGVRLAWPVPAKVPSLEIDDLAWTMQQLDCITPMDLFEEVKQQNLDLLQALREARACRTQLECLRRQQHDAA
jgi:hypothetical protein